MLYGISAGSGFYTVCGGGMSIKKHNFKRGQLVKHVGIRTIYTFMNGAVEVLIEPGTIGLFLETVIANNWIYHNILIEGHTVSVRYQYVEPL